MMSLETKPSFEGKGIISIPGKIWGCACTPFAYHSGQFMQANPNLNDANTAGTSKLDRRCFQYYQIDGNENLIPENLRRIKKDKNV